MRTPSVGVSRSPVMLALASEPCATAASAVGAIDQCDEFLASLNDAAFVTPSPVMLGATIGQHVRHALDHYGAALSALLGQTIDYDRRERGTEVESSLTVAREQLGAIRDSLETITTSRSSMPVRVRVMIDAGTGEEAEHASTLGREVAFAAHHAIHHHAMIAAIAKSMGLHVPPGFGKAPSTLHHESHA